MISFYVRNDPRSPADCNSEKDRSMSMQPVELKNGQSEAEGLVRLTMISLQMLMERNPVAFYELVMKCRDRKHVLFGNTGKVLEELAMTSSDGSVHDSIRNIVLSAVSGEELNMTLGSPLKSAK